MPLVAFTKCYLVLLFLLPLDMCQEDEMEVSRRYGRAVARVVQSHQQTFKPSNRETKRQPSNSLNGTDSNSTSTKAVGLWPEVDDLEHTSLNGRVQEPVERPHYTDCSQCCRGDGLRGYPGPSGAPGIPGNHGNNGNNGLPGREGTKGEKGDKGDLGPRGERGLQGLKGQKGQHGLPSELQVAFMASLATHFTNQNSGIIFSSVETNSGSFFDVMTGRFGAPVAGVYFFTFSMLKHEDVEEVFVYLMHNGNTIISMHSAGVRGKQDSGGNSAVLKLVKGDEVWLRMGTGALHGDHYRYCTFSGFLLFEVSS
ncbi:complement C1q tumor necrosis factor-related protein 3 [Protopterus annectens]|uniref:complement C1q tumor necrosis factor-related protein 3 n=1 Tax=Protopterus annectens TaxID=7888 RepID=UPI001CFA345C|nr:complement C1q tumor necrosis factor-related protein 3 [Protopterus annectens]